MHSSSPALPIAPARPVQWTTWALLFTRLALFLAVQAAFALGFYAAGSAGAWEKSANWWPVAVTITNILCLLILTRLFKADGKNFWDIFRISREHFKSDLLPLLGILVITGPVAFLPNLLLASWLFGNPELTLELILRPLPVWAVYASIVLFPVTQGLTEGPMYFAAVMPRLEAQGTPPWQAVAWPALLLGLQHVAVPFLFDLRFITWRALMFIPFALLVGIVLHWRPRLLPYLAVVHALIDMAFAAMLLGVAY
jgi:hypothetical protein